MSKTLFVGGLAFTTTEKDLEKYFRKFGDIEKVNIVKDRKTKASKGYGFVFFASQDPVDQITSQKHTIKGRLVDCQEAKKKDEKKSYKEQLSKTRIFVTCLGESVNNADMRNYFSQFGPLKSAYVIRDPDTERSLGFGFVIFEKPGDARKIIRKEGLVLKGGKINCDTYKEADEGKEGIFDPVGKRMKRIYGARDGERPNWRHRRFPNTQNHKRFGNNRHRYNEPGPSWASKSKLRDTEMHPNTPGAKKPEFQFVKKRTDRKIQSNSGKDSKSDLAKKSEARQKVTLFELNERELEIEKKRGMLVKFRNMQKGVLQYSHIFGGNLRMNYGGQAAKGQSSQGYNSSLGLFVQDSGTRRN